MPNSNNPKDVNDLRARGIDPLSVPAESVTRGRSKLPNGHDEDDGRPTLPWEGENSDWWLLPAPNREWLVYAGSNENAPGYLPRGEVAVLAGRGAAGKTWALVALSIAVAMGRPWLGYWTRPTSGRVAFLAAEESAAELRRRFQAQAAMVATLDNVDPTTVLRKLAGRVLILDRKGADIYKQGPALVQGNGGENWSPSIFGRELLADLSGRAEKGGWTWDLVVLDPLSAFGAVDTEKDSAAATATMREIEKLTQLPGGPLVLVAHHTKKAGNKTEPIDADDIRGSSGIVNRARWAAILSGVKPVGGGMRAEDTRFLSLEVVKGNYGPEPLPLEYAQPACLPDWKEGNQVSARGAIRALIKGEADTINKMRTGSGGGNQGKSTNTNNKPGNKGAIDASNI